MNVDDIRNYCLAFPDATETLQWDDALCFKVRGKMFAVLGLDRPRFTFKCTPDTLADLIEREDIRPSPYLGRYNWVMLDRLDALPNDELQDRIRQSYEMVSAKAPRVAHSSKGGKAAKKIAMKGSGRGRIPAAKSRKKKR